MFPKYAETVGGIPRRALTNPRAMESLASADLSIASPTGSASVGSVFRPQRGANTQNLNKSPNNEPAKSGIIYVTPQTANTISNRSKSMTAGERKSIKDAVRNVDRNRDGGVLPAIAVPYNSFLEARQGNKDIKPYRLPRDTSSQNTPTQTALRSQNLNRQLRNVPSDQIGE